MLLLLAPYKSMSIMITVMSYLEEMKTGSHSIFARCSLEGYTFVDLVCVPSP